MAAAGRRRRRRRRHHLRLPIRPARPRVPLGPSPVTVITASRLNVSPPRGHGGDQRAVRVRSADPRRRRPRASGRSFLGATVDLPVSFGTTESPGVTGGTVVPSARGRPRRHGRDHRADLRCRDAGRGRGPAASEVPIDGIVVHGWTGLTVPISVDSADGAAGAVYRPDSPGGTQPCRLTSVLGFIADVVAPRCRVLAVRVGEGVCAVCPGERGIGDRAQ